jgi:hypothetical protein
VTPTFKNPSWPRKLKGTFAFLLRGIAISERRLPNVSQMPPINLNKSLELWNPLACEQNEDTVHRISG